VFVNHRELQASLFSGLHLPAHFAQFSDGEAVASPTVSVLFDDDLSGGWSAGALLILGDVSNLLVVFPAPWIPPMLAAGLRAAQYQTEMSKAAPKVWQRRLAWLLDWDDSVTDICFFTENSL